MLVGHLVANARNHPVFEVHLLMVDDLVVGAEDSALAEQVLNLVKEGVDFEFPSYVVLITIR